MEHISISLVWHVEISVSRFIANSNFIKYWKQRNGKLMRPDNEKYVCSSSMWPVWLDRNPWKCANNFVEHLKMAYCCIQTTNTIRILLHICKCICQTLLDHPIRHTFDASKWIYVRCACMCDIYHKFDAPICAHTAYRFDIVENKTKEAKAKTKIIRIRNPVPVNATVCAARMSMHPIQLCIVHTHTHTHQTPVNRINYLQ